MEIIKESNVIPYSSEKLYSFIIDIKSTSSIELLIGKNLKTLDSHDLKLIY